MSGPKKGARRIAPKRTSLVKQRGITKVGWFLFSGLWGVRIVVFSFAWVWWRWFLFEGL